jgi:response regulator RpfG family c-di-GMP phosphodiesterase
MSEVVQRAAVLLVDDDEALLSAMTRLLRPDGVRVITANSGERALELLEEKADSLGVVISDYAMPGMTGADVLRAVRMRWPDLTRVLASGNADLAAAARAVNEGQVSRLVTKPWDPDQFRELVAEALEGHRLVIENRRLRDLADEQAARLARQAERLEQWNQRLEDQVKERTAELETANANLQRGLLDTVRLLVGFLERRLPERAARSREVARLAGRLAERLKTPAAEVRRIQVAALVHDIGLLTLPEALTRVLPENLPPAGMLQYKNHASTAHGMLASVEQLNDIALWVRSHHERWDGFGYPDRLAGPSIPLASRLIALADGYLDALGSERGTAPMWRRRQLGAGAYDPELVEVLGREVTGEPEVEVDYSMAIADLKPGMQLLQPVRTAAGAILLRHGEKLTPEKIERLQQLLENGALESATVQIDTDVAA